MWPQYALTSFLSMLFIHNMYKVHTSCHTNPIIGRNYLGTVLQFITIFTLLYFGGFYT